MMKHAALALFLASCSNPAPAPAGPFLEKTDLFEAGQGGYAFYRIPGMVRSARGVLIVYCEARQSPGDWARIDLVGRRSLDGGKTWEPARKMVEVPSGVEKNPVAFARKQGKAGEITMHNAAAIADRSGAVHFLFCAEYSRCFYTRSDDDGATWSTPVEISSTFEAFRPEYDWKVLATGPAHGIQLRGGRLVVPVWMSLGTESNGHRPSCVATIWSDDAGKTWKRGDLVCNTPKPLNPSETVAVELSDGRVLLNIRHESKPAFRAVTTSADGATAWSALRFDEQLPETVCMGSIARLDAERMLFANPHVPGSRERKNLTVKLSRDDGKTWPSMKALEPGKSGYSDLAVAPDGTIFCFYERGATGNDYLTKSLCFARFNAEWIEAP